MNVGYSYLGLAIIFVIGGAYLSLVENAVIGDVVLLLSLVWIYLGSTNLAEANTAEKLAENAGATTEETAEESEQS